MNGWKALVVAAAVTAGTSCAVLFASDTPGAEAHRLVTGGAKLIDVRSADEYAAGHIDGAVNIPVDEIDARQAEVGPKEAAVVLYCRTGNRSGRAAKLLREAGWKEVHNLGPRSNWE